MTVVVCLQWSTSQFIARSNQPTSEIVYLRAFILEMRCKTCSYNMHPFNINVFPRSHSKNIDFYNLQNNRKIIVRYIEM